MVTCEKCGRDSPHARAYKYHFGVEVSRGKVGGVGPIMTQSTAFSIRGSGSAWLCHRCVVVYSWKRYTIGIFVFSLAVLVAFLWLEDSRGEVLVLGIRFVYLLAFLGALGVLLGIFGLIRAFRRPPTETASHEDDFETGARLAIKMRRSRDKKARGYRFFTERELKRMRQSRHGG